jgi:hypothetical protein
MKLIAIVDSEGRVHMTDNSSEEMIEVVKTEFAKDAPVVLHKAPKTITLTPEQTIEFMKTMCANIGHVWDKRKSRWKCERCKKMRKPRRHVKVVR